MLLFHRNKGLEIEAVCKADGDLPHWAVDVLEHAREEQFAIRVVSTGQVSLSDPHLVLGDAALYVSPEKYEELLTARGQASAIEKDRVRAAKAARLVNVKRAAAEHLIALGMPAASGG